MTFEKIGEFWRKFPELIGFTVGWILYSPLPGLILRVMKP